MASLLDLVEDLQERERTPLRVVGVGLHDFIEVRRHLPSAAVCVVVAAMPPQELHQTRRVELHELAVKHSLNGADADLHGSRVNDLDALHNRPLANVPGAIEHRGLACATVEQVADFMQLDVGIEHDADEGGQQQGQDDNGSQARYDLSEPVETEPDDFYHCILLWEGTAGLCLT